MAMKLINILIPIAMKMYPEKMKSMVLVLLFLFQNRVKKPWIPNATVVMSER
ncbi:MAG: hypothetical protein RBG13Loki_1923 [Promethearchaeota archaeon CR_4]|nr:MAG: hypothetical protein RBG13Loki_1923 [Candidatus Lokiarchaeota archaeon CR_4]